MADYTVSRREFFKLSGRAGVSTAFVLSGLAALTELLGGEKPTLLSSIYALSGIDKNGFPDPNMHKLGWVDVVNGTSSLMAAILNGKNPNFKCPKGVDTIAIGVSTNQISDRITSFLEVSPAGVDLDPYYFSESDGKGNILPDKGPVEVLKDMRGILRSHPGTQDITFDAYWDKVYADGSEIAGLLPNSIKSTDNWPERVRVTKNMNAIIHSPESSTNPKRNTSVSIQVYEDPPSSYRGPIAFLEWSSSDNNMRARMGNVNEQKEVRLDDTGFLEAATSLSNWFSQKVEA